MTARALHRGARYLALVFAATVALECALAAPPGAPAASDTSIENDFLRVQLEVQDGSFRVRDKQADIEWVPLSVHQGQKPRTGAPACRKLTRLTKPHPGLRFEIDLTVDRNKRIPATVTLRLAPKSRDLHVEIAAPAETPMQWCGWPAPLVPARGDAHLATTAYNGGMLYPLVKGQIPRRYGGWELPFFGVTSLAKGCGYACIYETPFDVQMRLETRGVQDGQMPGPGITWRPCKGTWGYTRKLLYRFEPTGGYVALAKAYRRYAKATGILKTLREKTKRRPDLAKLLGAPDVWGGNGLPFCRKAKAAGIDRMLVNGSWPKKDIEAIKTLGYLVSRYDNYEDMMEGKSPPHGLCKVPDDQVLMAGGKRMQAWPVYVKDSSGRAKRDPTTGKPIIREQFAKRCSVLYEQTARKWVPRDQAKHPRNARFIDVSTACGLRECYDQNHPHTREGDAQARCRLAKYFADELGLVTGGEHGAWWAVPYYDYWEGMQSGSFYSWPAGHLFMDLPRKRDEIGKDYLKYGIGCEYRIPLWELVFGDCTVSYWYWGDSTGHLYSVAPEISRKKDLFNMLYGTLPLYWVDKPAGLNWSKPELRKRLLDSYRITCKLHEHTGDKELLSHKWLTADRKVQRSDFADGTFVVVNFNEKKTYKLEDQGKTWELSPLGFYARGPKVHQYRIRAEGRDVTWVHTPRYWFADGAGRRFDFGPLADSSWSLIRQRAPHRLLWNTDPDRQGLPALHISDLVNDWNPESTCIIAVDKYGQPYHQCTDWEWEPKRKALLLHRDGGTYQIRCGNEARLPNLAARQCDIRVLPQPLLQGVQARVEVTVRNPSHVAAKEAQVDLFVDQIRQENRIGSKVIELPGRAEKSISFSWDTSPWDGSRVLWLVLDPAGHVPELLEEDNRIRLSVLIRPDLRKWSLRAQINVKGAKSTERPVAVATAVDFARLFPRADGGGRFDLSSVRVCAAHEETGILSWLPCQFEQQQEVSKVRAASGELVWLPLRTDEPKDDRAFLVFFDVLKRGPKRAPYDAWALVWRPNDIPGAVARDYLASFRQGTIDGLTPRVGWTPPEYGGYELAPVFGRVIYSSAQTGWSSEEEGKVLSREVLANGPVRAVVRVKKQLKAGVVVTRTYTFWPDRIDVDIEASKDLGVLSRAYYALGGTYEDSAGNKAVIDGHGQAEGVAGRCPNPKWYAVYTDKWAHSCIARTEFHNITYWDAGGSNWGGVGFQGSKAKVAKISYVFHGGQKDASFAKGDYERLMNPPTVRILPAKDSTAEDAKKAENRSSEKKKKKKN